MTHTFKMVAKTFQGLEGVLADELRELGAQNVEEGRRMVSFEGDKEMLYRANFCLRTALRVLKPFYSFKAKDADELYAEVKKFNWESVLNHDRTLSIDSTVFSEEFRHSKFVTYRVKDAIVDFFKERYDKRPSIRLDNPDVIIDVHISGTDVILSLDSSGESLHKRGYRVASTEAPISEVLAAGILRLAGWDGTRPLLDPMCGSGTFLIEAAMMATGTYPGVYRKDYAFERWDDFDADLLESIYNDDSNEREFSQKIFGSDISPKAVEIARRNIKSAGMAKYIELSERSFQSIEEVPANGLLVTNPPYGERLQIDDIQNLYNSIGERLKRIFTGYDAWIIGYPKEAIDAIGLKPSVKYPLLNGQLECELRQFKIFDGKYDDLRAEGKHIKNDTFRRSERRLPSARPRRKNFDEESDNSEAPRRRFRDEKPPRRFGHEDGHKWFDKNKERKPRFADSDRPHHDDEPRRHKTRPERFGAKKRDENGMPIFPSPRLGEDAERPIIHGRRNGWKRKDID